MNPLLFRGRSIPIACGTAALRALASDPSHADIGPFAQTMTAHTEATASPGTPIGDAGDDADFALAGTVRNLAASATSTDCHTDRALAVGGIGAVTFQGSGQFTLTLHAFRSGVDDDAGNDGGLCTSAVRYEPPFLAPAAGTLVIDHELTVTRPSTGTFTPVGVTLRRGRSTDGRSLRGPYSLLSGIASGSHPFDLIAGGFHTLAIEVAMSGASSNIASLERDDAVFSVRTSPMTRRPVPEPATWAMRFAGHVAFGSRRPRPRPR